ncbi:hypothetical protein B0J13DRAFT_431709 [Dactylonectria estremocensis]|uniref:Zn(2)-C6 fungal-type domain-containing protein n=1 Tax=Dactylonectria estremocensis TaxID=1079267 RepID=A0A9P9JEE8_9HYPO|nr:hypothetical protein B0J13DRAFT_431709 [Dactylonectria estremocensis]
MAGDASPSALRNTQRAPRSCRSCASRKVKCDKSIPCSTCVRRGDAESCAREMVLVRGMVTSAKDPSSMPSYQELLEENNRLRNALGAVNSTALDRPEPPLPTRQIKPQHLLESPDVLEKQLFEQTSQSQYPLNKKLEWAHIILPGRKCSEALIAFDKKWNAWAHCALEYPTFEHEHRSFMESIENGASLSDLDPAWLSVYFSILSAALLMMDEEYALELDLPGDPHGLIRNWYEAALLCLNRADFMRKNNVRSVQTIAVLGMCVYNFGDSELHNHLWSCAVRIAQALGLDGSRTDSPVMPLGEEAQRRLWWTLVICEWLCVPYHVPQVAEADFYVPLPSTDPDGNHIQPVQYHIVMARTSTVYHRFRESLRRGGRPVAETVHLADQELAEVINSLPEHLQPDGGKITELDQLEAKHPWIKWQRFDVSLVLLHHRLRIHRALQAEWLEFPGQHDGARAICMRSARDIIWIAHNWDQPAAMRRQWALSFHVFVAATLLLRESKAASLPDDINLDEQIAIAISYLDETKSRNMVADKGSRILRRAIADHGL